MLDDDSVIEVTTDAERLARGLLPTPPRAPRFGIVHLLVWMLGSAMVLSVLRLFDDEGAEGSMRVVTLAYSVVVSMLTGASLGGVMIWSWRALRGGPAHFGAPGHFLLVMIAVEVSFSIAFMVALRMWQSREADISVPRIIAFAILISTVRVILALIALARSLEPRWRIVFGALAALILAQIVKHIGLMMLYWSDFNPDFPPWLGTAADCVGAITFVAIVVAITIDVRGRSGRDWLHYTGVGVFLLWGAAQWLRQLGIAIFREF